MPNSGLNKAGKENCKCPRGCGNFHVDPIFHVDFLLISMSNVLFLNIRSGMRHFPIVKITPKKENSVSEQQIDPNTMPTPNSRSKYLHWSKNP